MTVTSFVRVGAAAGPGHAVPSLRLAVASRARPDRAVFRARRIVVAMIAGGMLAISLTGLLLHIAMADSVYQLASLQTQARELGVTQQILSDQVDRASSMDRLTTQAQKMGMIVSANPVYLRLSDSRVFGSPDAVRFAASGVGALAPGYTVTPTYRTAP